MSKYSKGKTPSTETRRKISEGVKRWYETNTVSDETRRKISEGVKSNRPPDSIETKRKRNKSVSEAAKNRWRDHNHSIETKRKELFDKGLKECSKCKEIKSLDEFSKGMQPPTGNQARGWCTNWCRSCSTIYKREWCKNNRERQRAANKKYREKNKDKVNAQIRKWYELYGKEHRKNNRDQLNAKERKRTRERRKKDPIYKLRKNISRTIAEALHRNDGSKRGESVMKYLPYTIEELREHLESKWLPGMTWDNHTHEGWHLDHIIPQSKLLYDSMDHPNFQKCWALENLQPLWAKDNISKSNKIL